MQRYFIEYETTSKNSGCNNADCKYNLEYTNNNKQNKQRNIIWIIPPLSQTLSTNVAKHLMNS